MRRLRDNQEGLTLVEILIAIAIIGIGGIAVISMVLSGSRGAAAGQKRTEGVSYAREGVEAMRSIGRDAYNRLIPGTYGLDDASGAWQFSGSSDANGIFTRSVEVGETNRGGGGNIAASGTPDIHTRTLTTTISWDYLGQTLSMQFVDYLMNWDRLLLFEDTDADFSNGTLSQTEITTDGDGEIRLDQIEIMEESGAFDASGNQDGNDVYVVGDTVYLVRDGGTEFYVIDASDIENPVELDSLNLSGDANDVVVLGDFAYVATDNNSEELVVIDVSDPSDVSEVATYNLPGNDNALSVAISGNTLLLGRGVSSRDELNVFNVTIPTSPSLIGGMDIPNDVNSIQISGSHAFLATRDGGGEVVSVNISVPALPVIADTLNLTGSDPAQDIWVSGDFAYVVHDQGSSGDLAVIDISDPTDMIERDIEPLSGGGNAVWSNGTIVYVGTDVGSAELIRYNCTDPDNMVYEGAYDVGDWIYGIMGANDHVYAATRRNDGELVIMSEGIGSGGGFGLFEGSGTYESSVLDAGSAANWNTIEWSEDILSCSGSDLTLQVRTASTSIDLASELWQGPDGEDADETDVFTDPIGALLHTDHNGDQFFQYRVNLSADTSCTPELQDISVTYTPY